MPYYQRYPDRPLQDCYRVKSTLDKCRGKILRHFVLSPSVFDVMRQERLLPKETLAIIRSERTSDRRVKRLLDFLRFEGVETFIKFIRVLRLTGHGWLADDMDEEIGYLPEETGSEQDGGGAVSATEEEVNEALEFARTKVLDATKAAIKKVKSFERLEILRSLPQLPPRRPAPIDYEAIRTGRKDSADKHLQNLIMHYDNERQYFTRRYKYLLKEQHALAQMMQINNRRQEICRRKFANVSILQKQMDYVAAKNWRLRYGTM
ncbi:uncharacterized protein LOC141911392 isoform X1 [Tubulanus polymorphus]|uniref:uncharacterized protein LOC141911392 isoform X1 n=1 Tax=Tubulanus polymorphus TaxID=672921 RepID=UPI003DA6B43E